MKLFKVCQNKRVIIWMTKAFSILKVISLLCMKTE